MSSNQFTLPPSETLNRAAISALSDVFKYTASSYKFLWAFAIFERIENSDDIVIPFEVLCDSMLANAIVPINRYKLNFGFYDRLDEHLTEISRISAVQKELAQGKFDSSAIQSRLLDATYKKLQGKVPHRWLSAFFTHRKIHNPTRKESGVRDAIAQFAKEEFEGDSPPPYMLDGDKIVLHPLWRNYFKQNMPIVRGWLFWHWANYLQNLNPNIPAIANKIGFPESRSQWCGEVEFWQKVIATAPQECRCIYSGEVLGKNFHLDHYVPWSFVGHNRPWNIAPVTELANIRKGDKLPHNDYFAGFVSLQNNAIATWKQVFPNQFKPVIEAYRVDLQLTAQQLIIPAKLQEALARTILPLVETAKNNYFEENWQY